MKRPIVQTTPEPGQIYHWLSWTLANGLYLVLSIRASEKEHWLCQALNLEEGHVTFIRVKKRVLNNGWAQL